MAGDEVQPGWGHPGRFHLRLQRSSRNSRENDKRPTLPVRRRFGPK